MAAAWKVITVGIIILTAIAPIGPIAISECYAKDVSTFSGTVSSLDTDKSILTVEGAITVAFPVSSDTKLRKDIFDIKFTDIKIGDYVVVGYYDDDNNLGNGPTKVLSVTVEYGSKQ